MKTYAIGQLTIHNKDWVAEYNAQIAPLIKRFGGEVIAKGEPTRLEGRTDLPHLALCIAFPDREAANNWYHSPENQALVALRQTGSTLDLALVDAPV